MALLDRASGGCKSPQEAHLWPLRTMADSRPSGRKGIPIRMPGARTRMPPAPEYVPGMPLPRAEPSEAETTETIEGALARVSVRMGMVSAAEAAGSTSSGLGLDATDEVHVPSSTEQVAAHATAAGSRSGVFTDDGARGAGIASSVPAEADTEMAPARPAAAKPVACLVIGMAGSGKTTLMKALSDHLAAAGQVPYLINSDPAVAHVPYVANIDIRDAVNYKQVMKQYGLGPNGGILTSLNLFATKFDQVLELCIKRSQEVSHILVDTPGQIEAFTWSASGQIITEALASEFPTCVLFVVDIPRSNAPRTFMSNMLYACSILYKTRLPIVVALNKSDVESGEAQLSWMEDFEQFQEALDNDTDVTYASTLTRSMSLVLDEFYSGLTAVPVSAATGSGLGDLAAAIVAAAEEYETGYAAEVQASKAARAAKTDVDRAAGLARLKADVEGVATDHLGPAAETHLTTADVAAVGAELESSVGPDITARAADGAPAANARSQLMREAPEMGVMANGVRQPGWEPDEAELEAEAVSAAAEAELAQALGPTPANHPPE